MAAVKRWLSAQGIAGDQIKEILNHLKDAIFNNLKPSDVDPKYYDFLKGLQSFIGTAVKTAGPS
jgi:hypothetical protein